MIDKIKMSTETIKISLIHICNRTIHEGEIILTGDYPNCVFLFTSSISQDIEVKGHDYFACLINLRIELEKLNYYPLCNGARRDVSCGGMLRESSGGCLGRTMKLGKYRHVEHDVYIFDYAKPDLVVSVNEQEKFEKFYSSSLEMDIERMKISLIHICNRTIHEGEIILNKDNLNCSILFTSSISQDIEVKGHDYFACLINLRIELEKLNYYPLCNGARRDISCGGMLRESSEGRLAYIIRLGEYCDLDEDVEVFEYAEPDLVVSVSEQEKFNDLHSSSLPEIISYYAEFAKSISSKTKENIINQLSSHSNWQLLQRKSCFIEYLSRESDKLLFKFLNTSDRPHWNIDIKFDSASIDILFTVGNDTNQEAFLTFLNEQLSLNGVVYDLKES
jgi:hypothetical protein